MKRFAFVATALLAIASPASAADFEIQFGRGALQGHGRYQSLVTMKNDTDKDYAAVAWSCKFERDGYKVGESMVVFHNVRSDSIAFETMVFAVNSNDVYFDVSCKFEGVEEMTRDNARLYRNGAQRGDMRADHYQYERFWTKGGNHGQSAQTTPKPPKPPPPSPVAMTVKPDAVGCAKEGDHLTYGIARHMKEEGKAVDDVLIDMIETRRCVAIPVAVELEVVQRRSGFELKSACVRPYGAQSKDCFWLEEQDLVPTK